jgi:hypothetical protein
MKIKIKIQNKFYFWLNGEIEKKNQFCKKSKNNFLMNDEIEKNNNFYKRAKKEIKNKNNED